MRFTVKRIEKWDRQNINLYIISFTEIEGRSKREKRYAGLDSDLLFRGKRRKPAEVAPAVLAELYSKKCSEQRGFLT